jgi:hypothetical protein
MAARRQVRAEHLRRQPARRERERGLAGSGVPVFQVSPIRIYVDGAPAEDYLAAAVAFLSRTWISSASRDVLSFQRRFCHVFSSSVGLPRNKY